MRKNPLPAADKAICRRLKELRMKLGLTEAAAARAAGITRHLWHSMEMLRAPLRCRVAFKICRQLIVSEEWLATGTFAQAQAAAALKPIGMSSDPEKFYLRQCVDLQVEPEFGDLDPRMLFRDAFRALRERYGALVEKHFFLPRILLRDTDGDELLLRYIEVANQRWLWLIENEVRRVSRGLGMARRQFVRGQIEIGVVLFKRFMNLPTPEIEEKHYAFLQALAKDAICPLGPIHGGNNEKRQAPRGPVGVTKMAAQEGRKTVESRS
jgi:DNA-binding XRE family transcriptional regulator